MTQATADSEAPGPGADGGEPRPTIVTAATTPLGRALIQELHASNHSVLGVHADSDPRHVVAGVRYERVDLTRYRDAWELVRGAALELRVRAIVHTPLHRDPRDEGPAVWEQNVQSTRQLLALSEQEPAIERFVLRSFAEIYRVGHREPVLIAEDGPLDLSPDAPQRVRDRVEADLTVCAKMGLSPTKIAVLRCAEILEPDLGSQLYDYLFLSRLCLTPLGYDPMINVLSLADAARALRMAVQSDTVGIFNIPGLDTLPLSRLARLSGAIALPLPGPTLSPLYGLRALTRGTSFSYEMNRVRFHHSAVLDGRRAREQLGYEPRHRGHLDRRRV